MIVRLFNMIGVKPQERRSVILLLIGFFVIGNIGLLFLEVPSLRDDIKERRDKSAANEKLPEKEKLRTLLQAEVDDLRGDTKMVQTGAQALNLMELVAKEAQEANLNVDNSRPTRAATNKDSDFDEVKLNIRCSGDTVQLVEFLKRVSDNRPMVRVSDLTVTPNQDRKKLDVTLVFVASFPKEKKKPVSKRTAKKGT